MSLQTRAISLFLFSLETTYSISFALYHLGRNLEAQDNLYRESAKLLPNAEDPVTSSVLDKARYTKAVLKETFRLNPISVGIGRILTTDMVLSGYSVPQGVYI